MSNQSKHFLIDADRVSFDLTHRKKIKNNMGKYDLAVGKGKLRYSDIELAKHRAAFRKREVLEHLPELLEQFEKNALAKGSEVFWASTTSDAIAKIGELVKEVSAKSVVKSKSMTTEEIELNHHLEDLGVKSWETDLGEFIVQVAGEKPYHIVTPAMHKSKEDIDELFNKHFDTKLGSTPEELTLFVRDFLRQKYIDAEIGVTGANFLVADKGAACVTENEGNGILSASFPKIHVVIAGIEKIIPSMSHLGLFWPLLAAHGTGQQMTVYNSIFSASKKDNEPDGPERMIIILLDNGRSNLYSQPHLYEALSCIRCGACLNACPIYKNVGGYTYGTTYSGPIGSVITPHFSGIEHFKHLSYASTLCGKCAEVCPVKIPLPDLLLYNRNLAVKGGFSSLKERAVAGISTTALLSRFNVDFVGGKTKNYFASLLFANTMGKNKKLPDVAKTSFSAQWKQKRN